MMFSPVYDIDGGHSNTDAASSSHPVARVSPCYWFLARIILNMVPANLFDMNQLDSKKGPEVRLLIASKRVAISHGNYVTSMGESLDDCFQYKDDINASSPDVALGSIFPV
jgi:hypothetical protein